MRFTRSSFSISICAENSCSLALVGHDEEPDLRDQYNADRPFAVPADHANAYRERIADLQVFASADGARAAAEFTVHGEYLRTDGGLPVADGQTGELYVGGPVLASGYFQRPEEEALRFITLPGGARMLRTGDLVQREAVVTAP